MSKIPSPMRLLSRVLPIAVACFMLAELSGCGNHNDDNDHHGGGITINEDSVANHVISIAEARELTKNFRGALDTSYRFKPDAAKSTTFAHAEEFPSDLFYALLQEKDAKQGAAKGIRIYLGKDSTGKIKMVLVPVDSLGNDMIGHLTKGGTKTRALTAGGDGQAGEAGQYCPTICDGGGSGLNQ